jgi:prenylcysteine alpha-carboxyl methylesterase
LFYVHGGGFISGDKAWSKNVYANIGFFFASQGIITVCVNHQFVPDVQYPGGAVDMQMAREWVLENIGSVAYGSGDIDKVFLFGHSSGGAHIAMNLYAAGDKDRYDELSRRLNGDPAALWPPVAGVIFLDCPFWMDSRKPGRQYSLGHYYGSFQDEVWYPKSPLGLFGQLPETSPALDSQCLPTFLGTVEWEVTETSEATMRFFEAYRKKSQPTGALPLMRVFRKHNHLSVVLSIGTADTTVTDALLEFIRETIGGHQCKLQTIQS